MKMQGTRRRVTLDVFLMCWGMGTWLGVNGLYVQLPLLVERLPEGWALPSSMVLAVQLANLGPIMYGILRRFRPQGSDSHYIYGLLTIGTLSLLLNSFLHQETVMLGGSYVSLAFLALTFFTALVGCTSSVLFYPYMRMFRDIYLATYLVGEGLSGFIPSILSLVQGVGGEPECIPSADNSTLVPHYPPPQFDTMVFFLLLTVLAATSLVSFFAINMFKGFESEKVIPKDVVIEEESAVEKVSLLTARWIFVMVFMALLNAFNNGVLPSVQSYSCMPYGTRAYHLAVTLGNMANPAACLAGVWLRPIPSKVLAAIMGITLIPMAYILATSLMSPTPPLQHTAGGEALIVLAWVLVYAVLSYARMWVYGWAREAGARGMRTCGAVTQLGSAAGSFVLFMLVNYTALFTQPERCPAWTRSI